MIEMKIKRKYLIGIFSVLVIVVAAYYISTVTGLFVSTQPEGQYDNFTKCLTDEGATLYGAYWCSHCQNQKKIFGTSVKYINYVECDPRGDNAKPEVCAQNNISGYPTWIINGTSYEGEQSLQELSSLTGCPLQ
jgi:hypothetical protein